ncbi:MAG: bifunctional adenosylcobinamide kinase/adenosylcobinamide-phosphate guanylyltransferase [Deltaproteobacteria bacterium]|nr:bifunctional adenosylcobinamide kinase/adenosylcobinamide-phosphate guanylyltransferase [Deltaproteobacteria bacterium]
MKALITGGARSGKSRHALALAESLHPTRIFLATAEALDAEMAVRIDTHQRERGPEWVTIEEPLDLAPVLTRRHGHGHGDGGAVIVVDCLTLWLSNLMQAERDVPAEFARLTAAITAAQSSVVLVTNEVGFGIVPDSVLARSYRDHLGSLSQQVAAVCDRVVLVCAGLPLTLK